MTRTRNILHASDFSKASRPAFATALTMAKTDRATLTLVHISAITPVVPEQYLDPSTWDRINAQARRWGQRQLVRLAERAKKSRRQGCRGADRRRSCNGNRSRGRVEAGRLCRRGDARPPRFSKFFLGSVAERVVATAPCPVVTVRGT